MLENARVTAFTVPELLRENRQVGVRLLPPTPPPPRLGLIPKQMHQRLSMALAQVKSGNTCKKILNEIRSFIYSLYR